MLQYLCEIEFFATHNNKLGGSVTIFTDALTTAKDRALLESSGKQLFGSQYTAPNSAAYSASDVSNPFGHITSDQANVNGKDVPVGPCLEYTVLDTCKGNSTCIVDEETGTPKCKCPQTRTGQFCETIIRERVFISSNVSLDDWEREMKKEITAELVDENNTEVLLPVYSIAALALALGVAAILWMCVIYRRNKRKPVPENYFAERNSVISRTLTEPSAFPYSGSAYRYNVGDIGSSVHSASFDTVDEADPNVTSPSNTENPSRAKWRLPRVDPNKLKRTGV
jgi:hypothetical protein